jgi:hypothetical protein
LHRAGFEGLPPVLHVLGDSVAPFCIPFGLKQGQQYAQRFGRVPYQVNLHWVSQRQHIGRDVDLYAARLPFLRQEFRIGEAGPNHQQRIALSHHLVARLCTEQSNRTSDPRQIVGQHSLSKERFSCSGLKSVRDRCYFIACIERTRAHQDGYFLTGVENFGGALKICLIRHGLRSGKTNTRMNSAVLA